MAKAQYIPNRAGLRVVLNSPQGPAGRELLKRAQRIEARAKRNLSNQMVNVQTGLLRASTRAYVISRNGRLQGGVISNTSYAVHVHDGTRGNRGRPYLLEALNFVAAQRAGEVKGDPKPPRPLPAAPSSF